MADRLSIDITVVRDYLDADRPRHQATQELFALQAAGEVELIIAPQGRRDDVRPGPLADQINELITSGCLVEARQLAYLSDVTYPSKTLFPGAYVKGFSEVWEAIVGTWKTHERKPPGPKDRWHAETHMLERADVLITDDDPLRVMCQRLRDEQDISIVVMGLEEYLDARKGPEG